MKANICVVVFDGVSYVDEDFCVNLTPSKVVQVSKNENYSDLICFSLFLFFF